MRVLTIPAGISGIALAIVFFKVYGLLTRPPVPRPIAIVVDQFAPGVQIGAKVADMRHSVAAMTYVPHLGYVGMPKSAGANMPLGFYVNFLQVRLLLDERTRRQPAPDPAKARIDAVEIVSADPGAAAEISTAFLGIFRRPPRDGCLRTSRSSDEGRFRDVHVWVTPNERGGLALISDFGASKSSLSRTPVMTSVLAFTGKFDGGRTLRGDYTDASCTLVASQ
jgi:hypothetical protein